MKNLKPTFEKLTAFALLCSLIFGIQACQQTADPDTDRITEEAIEQMKKDHLITLNEAVKDYKKYEKDRAKILKDTLKKKYKDPKFSDTRMVWFDIEDVRAYLAYLDKETSDAEGLAFYFSVDSEGGKNKNHQSFFIAPTISNVVNGDTIQSGYTSVKGKRVFLYEKFKSHQDTADSQNVQKGAFFTLKQDDDDGYLYNKGGSNPPDNNN